MRSHHRWKLWRFESHPYCSQQKTERKEGSRRDENKKVSSSWGVEIPCSDAESWGEGSQIAQLKLLKNGRQ